MADFINSLRLGNTFSAPDTNTWNPDEARGMINMIYPLIKRSKDEELARQKDMYSFTHPQPTMPFDQAIHNQIFGNTGQLGNVANSIVGGTNYRTALGPGEMTDYQKAQVDLGNRTLEQKGSIASAKDQNVDQDRQIKQQRADIYGYKATHPDHKIITPGDGHVYAIDPKTDAKVDLGIDTLSNQEKLELQGQNQVNAINARGEVQQNLQNTRGEQNLAAIAARGTEQRNTNAAKPTTVTPTQQTAAHRNAARQILNQYRGMSDFIKFETDANGKDTGNFTIDPNTPPQVREWINSQIYGSQQPATTTPAAKPVTGTPTTTTPKATQPVANDPLGIR